MTIQATRQPLREYTGQHPMTPCIRCGVIRATRTNVPTLCYNCKTTMTKEEIELWTN